MDFLLRDQAPLTAEEWQTLDQTVVQVARRNLVARRFLTIFGPVGTAVQTLTADRFQEGEMAHVSLFGAEEQGMVTVQSRHYVPLPLLYRDFRLEWRDLETSRRLGVPLDTTGAAIAASAVAEMEDRLIFNGYDELQQAGFLNAEGRQRLPLGDWSQGGGAFAAVVRGIQTLTSNHFQGPFTLIVPPQLFVQLNRVYENTAVLEIDQIRRAIGGGVYLTPTLPPNVAVLIAAGQENMDIEIAQDMTVAFLETQAMDHNFRVLETLALRIKRPGAICTFGQV